MSIKQLLKTLAPPFLLNYYHLSLAILAKWIYGNPSDKLIVIGVTGTNGKSTAVDLIGRILEKAGAKVGWTSTVNFKIAGEEWLNRKKMTMVGRFGLQKLLKKMVKAGCQYAIIETSSEGIKQYRHLGINYDVAVFTNLTPEHLESHGNFDKYRQVKGKLFQHLNFYPPKIIRDKKVPKIIVANLDDRHSQYFLEFSADKKFGFTANEPPTANCEFTVIKADDIHLSGAGSAFTVNSTKFNLQLLGQFNVENALAAIAAAASLGISLDISAQALAKISSVPGRLEFIREGQNFQIMVDYAPETASLNKLYEFINQYLKIKGKIIHLLGSCGGGRDKSRRPILGAIAAANADVIIITNEDPYDENAEAIIKQVAAGAQKIIEQNHPVKKMFTIMDRRRAIHKALSLAEANDLVLLTGKGAEQFICLANGKKMEWDERTVIREELKKILR